MNTQYPTWRKSRRSEANGNCVEVARTTHATISVRDSKEGDTGPALEFTQHEWATFTHTNRSTPSGR